MSGRGFVGGLIFALVLGLDAGVVVAIASWIKAGRGHDRREP